MILHRLNFVEGACLFIVHAKQRPIVCPREAGIQFARLLGISTRCVEIRGHVNQRRIGLIKLFHVGEVLWGISWPKILRHFPGKFLNKPDSVFGAFLSLLFFFDDLTPNKPVCRDLSRVDRSGDCVPCGFKDSPDPLIETGLCGDFFDGCVLFGFRRHEFPWSGED
jgi:hypothetical protein